MKVSVLMITYNHEKYIAQAVNSVLMQQVDFDYELVVGEDCSTDNSRNVLLSFQERYPDKIRLLSSETNVGVNRNFIRTYRACPGQYIALLEGDDYWTSPHKLQQQVDFLENHSEFGGCFHNVQMYFEDETKSQRLMRPSDQPKIVTLKDLLAAKIIPTCAVMFRNGLFEGFPDWAFSLKMTDWLVYILTAQYGPFGYLDAVMATYRIHSGGVWSSMNYIQQLAADIEFLELLEDFLTVDYRNIIRDSISKRWAKVAATLVDQAIQCSSIDTAIEDLEQKSASLFADLELSPAWGRQILGQIYIHFAFKSWTSGDLNTARYCVTRAIQSSSGWLRNRGLWSISLQAFLIQPVSKRLHRGAQKANLG